MSSFAIPSGKSSPMISSQITPANNPPKMMLRSSFSTSPQFAHHATVSNRTERDRNLGTYRQRPPTMINSSTGTALPLAIDTIRPRASIHEGSNIASSMGASSRLVKAPTQSSAIAFCPSQYNLYACINCGSQSIDVSTDATTKRVGPILLELRRLDIVNDLGSRQKGQVFASSLVTVSRGNPALGNSVASTCLSFRPYPQLDPHILVPCATGLTTGGLCIHTFTEDGDGTILSSRENFVMPHQRAATAVAWRPKETRHVAIGLVGVGGITAGNGGAFRGGTRPIGSGDKDFCCLIWDVEAQPSSKGAALAPLSKHSHNTGVASMSWVSDGQTLAVGCQVNNMQLYDLRISGNSAPPSSISAHSGAVHGIEVDPLRPNILATFCRGPDEPVKIWDLRLMNTAVSEIKCDALSEKGRDKSFVSAVRWSCIQIGSLSVAFSNSIQHYDTSGSHPILTGSNMALTPIIDIAVNPLSFKRTFDRDMDDLAYDMYSNRMLTVVEDRTVRDIAKHTKAPLAISPRDGRLIHSLGRIIWAGTTFEELEGDDGRTKDISAIMKARARCLHETTYTINAAANIEMLLQESLHSLPCNEVAMRRNDLIQLWRWISRIETLCGYGTMDVACANWPAKGLLDAGVWQLLGMDESTTTYNETSVMSKALHCNTYPSAHRRMALLSCGWSDNDSVRETILKCESIGEYERAAALAVWQDDLAAAFDILQRGALKIHEAPSSDVGLDERLSYSQSMQLVAMCIAGYPGTEGTTSEVWRTACQNLLERQNLTSGQAAQSGGVYLWATCKFLANVGTDSALSCVLLDTSLRLSDRVAFACRFLEREELKLYLSKTIDESHSDSLLEGLIITGVDKRGLSILQAFVDRVGDVQTAALIVSRVVLPVGWIAEKHMCSEWLDSYRSLLNTWQMWQSRAMFDVDRAELLRTIARNTAERKSAEEVNGNVSRVARRIQPLKRHVHQSVKPTSTDPLLQSISPAQLDARCNYCSISLSGARRQESSALKWLSEQKPVLSCCPNPNCRKPLPRCAICLLPLRCLNRWSRSAQGADSLANLPFAEWFTWCMRCKHGGHAHHFVGWFANHETCPVSGCNCKCQFDGIKKLA